MEQKKSFHFVWIVERGGSCSVECNMVAVINVSEAICYVIDWYTLFTVNAYRAARTVCLWAWAHTFSSSTHLLTCYANTPRAVLRCITGRTTLDFFLLVKKKSVKLNNNIIFRELVWRTVYSGGTFVLLAQRRCAFARQADCLNIWFALSITKKLKPYRHWVEYTKIDYCLPTKYRRRIVLYYDFNVSYNYREQFHLTQILVALHYTVLQMKSFNNETRVKYVLITKKNIMFLNISSGNSDIKIPMFQNLKSLLIIQFNTNRGK